MGVTGLWNVVQPCARPIKIETLNKKRLAVDASIWIYQFLKAVRDKEGNALRNSHVVGFFRRICKLLFLGIKPVFVFDGGAPVLKRQTIAGRRARREGRRDDAVRTAGKLLALQMQRRAEEDERKRKENMTREPEPEQPAIDESKLVYADEVQMTPQERQKSRKYFKKKDQYHLPELDIPLSEMGGPNDPRIMSMEELQQYARQFDTGEDINIYDFSKIDFDSPFFTSLPASDRYNILNAARLRSRLRMGYSKDQLDTMFPDRMAFSKFQIERVAERNQLTQRLMAVGTQDEMYDISGRVAGEKGREYVLVKNPGVEGGWALGVLGDRDKEEGQRSKPINVDEIARQANIAPKDEEIEFSSGAENQSDEDADIVKRREAFYRAQRIKAGVDQRSTHQLNDELFVAESDPTVRDRIDGAADSEEESDIRRAIAMSLENHESRPNKESSSASASDSEEDFYGDLIQQSKAAEFKPFAGMATGGIAHLANKRAAQAAPSKKHNDDSSEDEGMNLEHAFARSRYRDDLPKEQAQGANRSAPLKNTSFRVPKPESKKFDGPLPFEKLDLGSSLLGKKKMEEIAEKEAGGFEKDEEKKESVPLPPWFHGDADKGVAEQQKIEHEELESDRKRAIQDGFEFQINPPVSRRQPSVIDIDAEDNTIGDPIVIDSSGEEQEDDEQDATSDHKSIAQVERASQILYPDPVVGQTAITLGEEKRESASDSLDDSEVETEQNDAAETNAEISSPPVNREIGPKSPSPAIISIRKSTAQRATSPLSSTESKASPSVPEAGPGSTTSTPKSQSEGPEHSRSSSEAATSRSGTPDVYFPEEMANPASKSSQDGLAAELPSNEPFLVDQPQEMGRDEFLRDADNFSDSEDEELLAQMATEAEEHARFASSLNNKSQAYNIEEYERELKALRSQQKRDRRDADEVTHIMITECQQLLKLFGLPYITAPMEAEAQCAELVRLGLVDGIVTDDSDCFLFGGTRIYKNMFNQAKFVECYLAADLERDFDLSRERLIRIAHLLGSDYTEGLPGIGPVSALEIVSEFPDGLEEFKNWWSSVQMAEPLTDADRDSAFRRKFRKNATRLFLPPTFPDLRVDAAYLKPEVDSDPSAFIWGVPDLAALRAFLMATIGWGPERTDEVLVPVIRDMNRREQEGTQSNITQFLGANVGSGAGAFAPRVRSEGKSKRMENALGRMAERARKRRKTVQAQNDDSE